MLYDSANFTFYIRKPNGLLPFNSYSVKANSGDGVFYHYLNREEERDKLSNRWKVLHHCGKKFIANEGTQYETEANPNEVVVYGHGVAKKTMLFMLLGCYILTLIFWGIDFFQGNTQQTSSYLKMGLVFTVLMAFLFGVMAFRSWDYREQAKEWNAVKIPDDKLFRHQIYISEILSMKKKLREINSFELNDIDFLDEHGSKIKISEKFIEDWKFTGLNICDFIDSDFYKKGWEREN